MRTDAAAIPVALISIISPSDWREHTVDEATFATSHEGRWTAICGAVVMSADLGSAPADRARRVLTVGSLTGSAD